MPGSDTELHEIPAAGLSRRPLLDARAAGRYTGLGERYIRRLRSERRIPCVRIGGRVLFDPHDLDELINRHREPALRPVEERPAAVRGNDARTSAHERRRAVG